MVRGPANSSAPDVDVERMQPLKVHAAALGHRDHVDGAIGSARAIDDRRRRDADLGHDLDAAAVVARTLPVEEGHLPERQAGLRVNRIDAVVLGRDVDDVA